MKLIVVAEDEYGHAEVLTLMLEDAGYRVAAASNGKAALELLAGERPALILSDFMMPHATGADFGNAVRDNPALRDIPFVIMSGTNEEVVRGAFKDYDAFLVKPFDEQTLMDVLGPLISNGRPTTARSSEIDESMRQLLKGIELPPKT